MHQRAVDLQFGERRRDQVVERAVAFAEVVLGQAEALHPQAAGTRVIVAGVAGEAAFQQFEDDAGRRSAARNDEIVQAIGQAAVVQQVRRQVHRYRHPAAQLAPLRLGANGLVEHRPEQFLVQSGRFQCRQESGGQQRAVPRVVPAHQRLGADDAVIGQRLLGLEPGLELPVAQGRRQLLAAELHALARHHGSEPVHAAFQALDQASDGQRQRRLGDQVDHRDALHLRHLAGAAEHPPRR
ncbi:hypothetical protein D9M71_138270 [compost metagenome]